MLEAQVKKEHYSSLIYDTQQRFVSYYNQKQIILELAEGISGKPTILEIGKGTGFLYDYLKRQGLEPKTFDLAQDLNPDYVGDVRKIGEVVKNKFDIICCFEILEHISFDHLEATISELSKITNKYLIISVPQTRIYFSFWFKFSLLKAIKLCLSIPFPLKHVFDGEHYWELEKSGYGTSSFIKILKTKYNLIRQFSDPLNPYHKFFILSNDKSS